MSLLDRLPKTTPNPLPSEPPALVVVGPTDGATATIIKHSQVVLPDGQVVGLHTDEPVEPRPGHAPGPDLADEIEKLREHLLGLVASITAIEVDVGFGLPTPEQIERADFDELRAVALRLSTGVCEVLR